MKEEEEVEVGFVKAVPLEEYLWELSGKNKLQRIIVAAGVYRDRVTNSTLAKYFSPAIRLDEEELSKYHYINDFVKAYYNKINLRWDNTYKNEMNKQVKLFV